MVSQATVTEESLQRMRDICERGMQRASEALTGLLGHPVRVEGARVQSVPPDAALDLMGGAAQDGMAALRCRISGDLRGDIVLIFPLASVFRMLQALLGAPAGPRLLSAQEESAVEEVGNILASSFLSELGDRLGRRVTHSSPLLRLGVISQMMDSVRHDVAGRGLEVLVAHARFTDAERAIQGRFFVLPELLSLQATLERPGGVEGATA